MTDWTVTVAGEIVRVERKDGGYTCFVRPRALRGLPAGAQLPAEVPIRVDDLDELEVGDVVEMTARAAGLRPTELRLIAVRRA